jgi:long-subunit fatty acid transport protein
MKRILFWAAFLIISGSIYAQDYNDVVRLATPGLGSNARALGMGNAYNSLSDDASAAFFNPAGFGLLKRLEFSGGIDYFKYNNNAGFLGENTEYSNSGTQLNRLSFAFPFPTMRGSLVFGLSYHRLNNLTSALSFEGFNPNNTMIEDLNIYSDIPYDLFLADTAFNTIFNGNLNQRGSILSSGNVGNWTFSGAIEAARGFFVGANLNIITGSYNFSNEYFEEDSRNFYQGITDPSDPETADFRTFNLNRIINWDISGWDTKVGFLYQLDRTARFGATIQFPKSFTIKEQFDLSGYSEFGTGLRVDLDQAFYSDEVEYKIITPFAFTGAFSVNFSGLIFSAEGTLTDYTEAEFSGEGRGLSREYINRQNREIKDNLRAVLNYNVGLEYTIPAVGVRLRGGFIMQPSAFKNDPSEYDRKYVTGGIGFLAQETIGIDLGYAYGWWETFGTNYAGSPRTNQEINVNNFVFTLTYRF